MGRPSRAGPDHDGQLRLVQYSGHARCRGRARSGQVSVFMCDTRDDPGRERRDVETLAPPGRRTDRHRPPDRAAPAGGGRARHPVVYAMTQPVARSAVLPDDEGGRAAAKHAARRPAADRAQRGPNGSWARGCARRGPAPRWRRPACGRPAACGSANGATLGPGGGRRLLAEEPGPTRSSAAATRSAAAWPTPRRRQPGHPGDVALAASTTGSRCARRPASADQRGHAPGRSRKGGRGLLLAAIAGEPARGTRRVPCRLVTRQSTRPGPTS